MEYISINFKQKKTFLSHNYFCFSSIWQIFLYGKNVIHKLLEKFEIFSKIEKRPEIERVKKERNENVEIFVSKKSFRKKNHLKKISNLIFQ